MHKQRATDYFLGYGNARFLPITSRPLQVFNCWAVKSQRVSRGRFSDRETKANFGALRGGLAPVRQPAKRQGGVSWH